MSAYICEERRRRACPGGFSFIKAITKTFDIKFNSNSSLNEDAKDKAMHEISFDKMGSDWTANFKLAWQGPEAVPVGFGWHSSRRRRVV